jgi:signal peptidase I
MWPFTPSYIKHAKLLHKGVTRFLNYKRDVLQPAQLEEISSLRESLTQAIRARDSAQINALNERLNVACERAIPDYQQGFLGENVEVFFVAIVIALGIRSFIAQPFQIPTGSMQPTLNGFQAIGTKEDPTPALPLMLWDKLKGKSYFNVVSDHSGPLMLGEGAVSESRFALIFTYSTIHFQDGHTIRVWAPKRQLIGQLGLGASLAQGGLSPTGGADGGLTPDAVRIRDSLPYQATVTKGQVLARGVLTTGDHVIVNKMAYHFRQPTRSEVFVFTTKNITGINVAAEQGSQHYIKRLAGVPGDLIDITPTGQLVDYLDPDGNSRRAETGKLVINGKPPAEPQFARVMSLKDSYNGYGVLNEYGQHGRNAICGRTLKEEEYCALGDNSMSSLDSRYWGHVPERNLVGVGFLCYWPLVGPHFGLID